MKKVFKILTLIMLILTIVKITDTYAKYYTKATATTNQGIANWQILINDTDIYSETGQEVEFTISPNLSESANTVPGKIAPGSVWSANINIDPTGTEVAVRYDIQIDNTSIVSMGNIEYEISVVDQDDTEIAITRTAANKYTGIISLEDLEASKKMQVTVSVTWNNNESTNADDTEFASTYGEKIDIPVKVICKQYLGETITPYT